jgi:hypothetical protein
MAIVTIQIPDEKLTQYIQTHFEGLKFCFDSVNYITRPMADSDFVDNKDIERIEGKKRIQIKTTKIGYKDIQFPIIELKMEKIKESKI